MGNRSEYDSYPPPPKKKKLCMFLCFKKQPVKEQTETKPLHVCACVRLWVGGCGRLCLCPVPFKLQEGEVRIISLSQCQSYFDMKTITPRMLCAGYDAGTVDSCMV